MGIAGRGVGRRVCEDLAAEAGAAADVEDEGRGCEAEEGQSAVRHLGLDVLDAGGGCVGAGGCVVVVEVWWAGNYTVSMSYSLCGIAVEV